MGSLPSSTRRRSTVTALERPAEALAANDEYIYVALCDYPPNGPHEYTISMGEMLDVISSEGEMYKVKSILTGVVMHVPQDCVAKVFNRWHFVGVSRRKAEELLLLPQNKSGSFLVRDSQTSLGSYSLSLLQGIGSLRTVKHYRIMCLQNGYFYILPDVAFPTLSQLVDYYSESLNRMCQLKQPCFINGCNMGVTDAVPPPMSIRRPSLNWKNLTSSMILRSGKAESSTAEPLVSEGLREAMASYMYFTEKSVCEDSDQSGGQ